MSHQIFNVEDSFAELKNIPDGEFDVVLTDPPYDEKCQENQISGTDVAHNGGGIGVPHIELPFTHLANYAFTKDLVRIAKRWALVFGTLESFGKIQELIGDAVLDPKSGCYVRGAVWYKPNAQGQMTGDRPAACYEGINFLHRPGAKEWNGRGSYGMWVCNGTRGEKNRHPNQKPLDLCLKLVALCTKRGETVFDPFCGSGRIGEACVRLGRNYVGFDLPLHDEVRVIRERQDDRWVRRKITVQKDWVVAATQRLDDCAEDYSDEEALKLCTAKKADILDTEDDYDYSAVDSD